jgi:hypothetical protein
MKYTLIVRGIDDPITNEPADFIPYKRSKKYKGLKRELNLPIEHILTHEKPPTTPKHP